MKVYITSDEMYPVYNVKTKRLYPNSILETEIEMTEELFKEYNEVYDKFNSLSDQIGKLIYNQT